MLGIGLATILLSMERMNRAILNILIATIVLFIAAIIDLFDILRSEGDSTSRTKSIGIAVALFLSAGSSLRFFFLHRRYACLSHCVSQSRSNPRAEQVSLADTRRAFPVASSLSREGHDSTASSSSGHVRPRSKPSHPSLLRTLTRPKPLLSTIRPLVGNAGAPSAPSYASVFSAASRCASSFLFVS